MAENSPLHPHIGRKTPAGGAHLYLGQANIFLVTVVSKDRATWMNQPDVHASLVHIWLEKATAWLVGYHLLMPDHMHFFCAPRDLHFGIDQWINYWKSCFSRANLDKSWEFQRRAAHHRIRDAAEYSQKWTYVSENPVRKGQTDHPGHWPFQGQVHELRWTGN
jgi:putative transposase